MQQETAIVHIRYSGIQHYKVLPHAYNLFSPLFALLTAGLGTLTAAAGGRTLSGLAIFPSSTFPSFSITGLCSCEACACSGAGLPEIEVVMVEEEGREVAEEGIGF